MRFLYKGILRNYFYIINQKINMLVQILLLFVHHCQCFIRKNNIVMKCVLFVLRAIDKHGGDFHVRGSALYVDINCSF